MLQTLDFRSAPTAPVAEIMQALTYRIQPLQYCAGIIAATMRVLVVEDERRLAAGLRKGLEAEGFAVDVAHNGTDGLWMTSRPATS